MKSGRAFLASPNLKCLKPSLRLEFKSQVNRGKQHLPLSLFAELCRRALIRGLTSVYEHRNTQMSCRPRHRDLRLQPHTPNPRHSTATEQRLSIKERSQSSFPKTLSSGSREQQAPRGKVDRPCLLVLCSVIQGIKDFRLSGQMTQVTRVHTPPLSLGLLIYKQARVPALSSASRLPRDQTGYYSRKKKSFQMQSKMPLKIFLAHWKQPCSLWERGPSPGTPV